MKFRRILLILALLLFAGGIVSVSLQDREAVQQLGRRDWSDWKESLVSTFVLYGVDPWRETADGKTTESAHPLEGIQTISYEGTNTILRVRSDATIDRLVVTQEHKETEKFVDGLKIDLKGDRLKIEEVRPGFLENIVPITVVLRVPTSYQGEIKLDVTNGHIKGENLKNAIAVDSVNAAIDLGMDAAVPVEVDSTNSIVDVHYDEAHRTDLNAEIEVVNGLIRVEGNAVDKTEDGRAFQRQWGDGSVSVRITVTNGMVNFNKK